MNSKKTILRTPFALLLLAAWSTMISSAEEFVVEKAGVALLKVANPSKAEARIDGKAIPAHEVDEGLLVFVQEDGVVVETNAQTKPKRMKTLRANRLGRQTKTMISADGGSVEFQAKKGTTFVGGFASEPVALHIDNPSAPRFMQVKHLEVDGDYGLYFRTRSGRTIGVYEIQEAELIGGPVPPPPPPGSDVPDVDCPTVTVEGTRLFVETDSLLAYEIIDANGAIVFECQNIVRSPILCLPEGIELAPGTYYLTATSAEWYEGEYGWKTAECTQTEVIVIGDGGEEPNLEPSPDCVSLELDGNRLYILGNPPSLAYWIYDSNGNLLANCDNIQAFATCERAFEFEPGTYKVHVRGYDNVNSFWQRPERCSFTRLITID